MLFFWRAQSLFKPTWEAACHENVTCLLKSFDQTTYAFFLFWWGLFPVLAVPYSYRPGNSVIWEKSCSRWQAVLSNSVWKSLQFSILWTSTCSITSLFQILSSPEVISFPFPSPLLWFSIEKLNDGHTSDWQASGKMALGGQLGECWALVLLFALCSSS